MQWQWKSKEEAEAKPNVASFLQGFFKKGTGAKGAAAKAGAAKGLWDKFAGYTNLTGSGSSNVQKLKTKGVGTKGIQTKGVAAKGALNKNVMAKVEIVPKESTGSTFLAKAAKPLTYAGIVLALAGGTYAYRRYSKSRQAKLSSESGIQITKSITVNKPVSSVYSYWRDFDNLSNFMSHVDVEPMSTKRSHWTFKTMKGLEVEWDAEITDEKANEWIAWRSLPGSQVETTGVVRFRQAPAGQGTEVSVTLEYKPALGVAGKTAAKAFGPLVKAQIAQDLKRFKQVLEVGEIATTKGQPSGRTSDKVAHPPTKGLETYPSTGKGLPSDVLA